MAQKNNMPDAAMALGDKRSSGKGAGVDTGTEHGPVPPPSDIKAQPVRLKWPPPNP